MNDETSWSGAREARLDRAIDRAVREMMHVDPPPGLRRRVLSRITAPVERRPWLLPRYAIVAAVLVILVLSATLMRRGVRPPVPAAAPPAVASKTAPAIGLPIAPEDSRTEVRVAPHAGSRGITRERIAMPRVTNVFGARTPSVSATVTSAESQAPQAMDTAPPAADPFPRLTITPLETPAIVVAPLVIPGPPKGGQ